MTSFGGTITSVVVSDIRFPTAKGAHGTDAMHTDPDYSAAYVEIVVDSHPNVVGHGFTFTLGRGTDIVVLTIKELSKLVVGRRIDAIFSAFGKYWRELTSESQLRWIGPEKGVVHLATAAVVNGLWDLWAKLEGKPLWKLLVDMPAELLVSTIDFRYITDAITPEEAIAMLNEMRTSAPKREQEIKDEGYPAYTTSCGWLGYSDELIRSLCKTALGEGFTAFKMKVGADLDDDVRRCAVLREELGDDMLFMVDANQRWEVPQAIEHMKKLARFNPYFIEEPTCPDDIVGHARIARALEPLGIKVATGEHCQNRIMFKQLLQQQSLAVLQIDACRVGGVNENLAILLLARKFNTPVWPHAGGVGLCELVQHLIMFDYIAVSGSKNRCEFVDHLHEHFVSPTVVEHGCYQCPLAPGFSSEMKSESRAAFAFPNGVMWKNQ